MKTGTVLIVECYQDRPAAISVNFKNEAKGDEVSVSVWKSEIDIITPPSVNDHEDGFICGFDNYFGYSPLVTTGGWSRNGGIQEVGFKKTTKFRVFMSHKNTPPSGESWHRVVLKEEAPHVLSHIDFGDIVFYGFKSVTFEC